MQGNTLQIDGNTYTVNQLKEFDNDSAIKTRTLLLHSAPGTPEDSNLLDDAKALSVMESSQFNQGQEKERKNSIQLILYEVTEVKEQPDISRE
ncbi:hypothetical protein JTB14_004254 [Gonioctena quinquepunctata]|nr:hypothetical protein JTB14_004254 [Gonioctena quinquepunctata]